MRSAPERSAPAKSARKRLARANTARRRSAPGKRTSASSIPEKSAHAPAAPSLSSQRACSARIAAIASGSGFPPAAAPPGASTIAHAPPPRAATPERRAGSAHRVRLSNSDSWRRDQWGKRGWGNRVALRSRHLRTSADGTSSQRVPTPSAVTYSAGIAREATFAKHRMEQAPLEDSTALLNNSQNCTRFLAFSISPVEKIKFGFSNMAYSNKFLPRKAEFLHVRSDDSRKQ